MSCTYTFQGKTYSVSEFHDFLASMPAEELMKYLPHEARRKVVMSSNNRPDLSKEWSGKTDENGDPMPEEARHVHQGIEGKDPIEIADWLANNAPPSYAMIAERVRDKLQSMSEIGSRFGAAIINPGMVAEDGMSSARGGVYPVSDSNGTALKLLINGSGMKGRVGTSYRTVLHELVHLATSQSIRLGETGNRQYAQSTKDLYDVSKAIQDHLYERANNGSELSEFELSVLNGRSNLLDNVHEVVAWAMASKEAQQYLESIPYKGKSIWTAFVDAVRGALGLQSNGNTALSEVLRVADSLMQPVNVDDVFDVDGTFIGKRSNDIPRWEVLQTRDGVKRSVQQPSNGTTAFVSDSSKPNEVWSDRQSSGAKYEGDTIEVDGVNRPTKNSNGKQIAQTEEGLRNFWKWFGDSRVVDADGRPLVVYHGTNKDFSAFSDSATKRYAAGYGFYFSPDYGYASLYAERRGVNPSGEDGANVIPVYLSIKKPVPANQIGNHAFISQEKIGDFKYKGHDGILLKVGNSSEYIVFDNTQIKSATGNSGSFDKKNPDIRASVTFNPLDYVNNAFTPDSKIVGDSGRQYSDDQRAMFKNVGRDVQKKTVVNKVVEYLQKDFLKKLAVGVVDQFRGLKDLADGGQAYMLARLSKGTAGAVEALFHHGKLSINNGAYDADMSGGFVKRLGETLNGELEDLLWWVAANRAERLSEEGRENLFTPEDIAAGKSLASGETSFDYTIQSGPNAGQVTRDRATIYEDANRVFNEFNKNVMDIAEQSGLIDGSQRQYWENEFYVPFYRVSEEEGEFVGARVKSGLVRQKAFDKLKGGSDKIHSDLLHNVMMNWSHLIDASAKNRAAKAALVGAENMGVAHKAQDGEKNTVWYLGEITRKIPAGQEYTEDGVTKVSDGTAEIVSIGQIKYKVDDPFVMTAITSLEYAGMNNMIMKGMSAFKHWLTIGVTASPAFKVRNLIRDSIQAIGTSELGYNPIKNIKEGFAASSRDSQDYVSALASGGLIRFGTMLEGSESGRIRQLIKKGAKNHVVLDSEPAYQRFYDKYLEPAVAAYNELGNRGEEINRSALFKQLKAQGVDHATAALMARDLMDFSMQGAFPMIRFLTQVVPFLNARLQGLYKLGRAAQHDKAKMAVVIGACAMISIALMTMYEDDDDWKRREDFDRDNNWWFKFAGLEVRIPKPFEIGAVASLAERSWELLTNDEMTGARFRKVTSDMLMNNLSMNPIPQMAKPVLEVFYNKDTFTGRPIETMGMQRLDKELRYNAQTTMVARGMSSVTGGILSPVQYDHLVNGYFSWLGASAMRAGDMAARLGSNEPEKPSMDYWKFATQGIVREEGTGSSRYVTFVYDQARELEQAYATYNRMIKDGNVSEAYQYKLENTEKLNRYRAVADVKKAQTKLNERIHEIEKGSMDSDAKKAAIQELNKRRESVAKLIAPN